MAVGAAFLLVIAPGVAGWFAHKRAQASRLEIIMREVFLQDRVSLEQLLAAESNSPSMTSREFYQACDLSIKRRDEFIAKVNSAEPGVNYPLRQRIISHLRSRSELVRRKREAVEKRLALRPTGEVARFLWARYEAQAYDRFLGEERRIEWTNAQVRKEAERMGTQAIEAQAAYRSALESTAAEKKELVAAARTAGLILPEVLKRFSPRQ